MVATAMCWPAEVRSEVAWEDVLNVKRETLVITARNAVEQQRRGSLPSVPVAATWSGMGNVEVEASDEWDADGDGMSQRIRVRDIGGSSSHVDIAHRIQIRFDEPINVLETGTGFALSVNAPDGLSPDLRVGVRLKIEGEDDDPVIFPDTPIVHRFGDNPHLVYFDLGYIFDHSVRPMQVPPREYFESVVGLELTLVHKRLPVSNARIGSASGSFHLDGLAVVDWFDGSYDNARFPDADTPNGNYPIVAQGRTQQVALIAAKFGGEPGIASAVRAMDMMARIQSWDGSWPEMRTRMQGEWTHGMIMADLARALRHMRDENRPELDEAVTVRHWEMTRDELYEQMLYRSALSRSPGGVSDYDDSYLSRGGALTSGANRPMTFALGQHLIAQVLTDESRKQHVMTEYDANVDAILAAQGVTAGGWPIFGEGNRYGGDGLHWDSGYSTDHVAIMVNASRATDDPRWGEMIRNWQTVLEAMMLPDGRRIDSGLSERGGNSPSGLKSADILFQEAMRHDAPMMAQWGANVSRELWSQWPEGPTLWTGARYMRGYGLGAFLTWQVYDMVDDPQPRDLGIVFPRQWPVWTADWINKDGRQVRTSQLLVGPAGMVNTFEWEVGQYPRITAVPVMPRATGGAAVELQPIAYEGDVQSLSSDVQPTIATGPVDGEAGAGQPMADDAAALTLDGPTQVEITAEDVTIRFNAIPRGDGPAELTVRMLRGVEAYEHEFAEAEVADAGWERPGMNLADPATGTRVNAINCYPNSDHPIGNALDGSHHTNWLIGQFLPGSGVRFTFEREATLDKLVIAQGDWNDRFHLAKQVTVRLADGTEKQLSLEQAPGEQVELDLEGIRSDSLTIMVDEVYEREDNAGNAGAWRHIEILTGGE
ncbi:MAG: hypothetical protein WD009_01695 [Phycisphaeraceae bacterium]